MRVHYILKCVADALFLAIRNYHNRIGCRRHCRGRCYGSVYTVPVGVPMANHAIMHTFRGVLYINGVGIALSVYNQGCGRPRIANRQKPDTPLSLCGQRCYKLVRYLGVSRATKTKASKRDVV